LNGVGSSFSFTFFPTRSNLFISGVAASFASEVLFDKLLLIFLAQSLKKLAISLNQSNITCDGAFGSGLVLLKFSRIDF
jgi:hypothetical protein